MSVNSSDSGTISQERLWGSWTFNDQLQVKVGTEHSRISRWNHLYHHGNYLQTTISRPILAQFDGGQGILPLHHTGIELSGSLSKEAGIVEYWVAVSNGRAPTPNDKQRTRDRNNSKRLDGGLVFIPSAMPDLRIAASITYDDIPSDPASTDPQRALSLREWVYVGHVEYTYRDVTVLGEIAMIDHEARTNGRRDRSHTGYLQASYTADLWTPYVRFDYRNMSEGDPYFAPSGRDLDWWRQLVGVRYDILEGVAFKLEIDAGKRDTASGGGVTERGTFGAAFQIAWSL